jgi:alkylation response protein AidB-like acyl-CoA dehydrogenase
MPIALTDEHEAQRFSARRWLDAHCPPAVPRALLDAEEETLQPVWKAMAGEGWLGIHLPEKYGGQGFGLFELAVLLEETGWSVVPGPLLPTVITSALVAEGASSSSGALAAAVLPGLIDGSHRAAVSFGDTHLDVVRRGPDGELVVSGSLRPILSASTASLVLAPARDDAGTEIWCVLEVTGPASESEGRVTVSQLGSLDPTRRVGTVEVDSYVVAADRQLPTLTTRRLRQVAVALMAAEQVGGARWCLDTATEYAKVRIQFGRPIGQFQAVKHRLADMAVRVEQMTAVAWDAAVAMSMDANGSSSGDDNDDTAELATATAGALTVDGYARSSQECLQLLGGIGFTWEHDLHLHFKRAHADRQLLGETDLFRRAVATVAGLGVRRQLTADLPDEAEQARAALGPLMAELGEVPEEDRRAALVEAGLVVPHWPSPWGRDAGAVEQVVIDEQLAAVGISRPHIGISAWALPVIIATGTEDQQERWVRPSLLGQLAWCQLFSEPGAGSDLASLTTRAVRTDGGWLLTGQKVWTSMAAQADWGICLARTDPSVPKHEGITFFIVDMHSNGLDIRPLREMTGAAMFNEVFLDEVFVPDDCVIGEVNSGWAAARMTLANERISMSSGSTYGIGVESLLRLAAKRGDAVSDGSVVRLGGLLAEAQSISLMSHRATLLALAGSDPGPGAGLRKLLGVEHEQRVQELGLAMLGAEGATTEGRSERWIQGLLFTRCLTIAGGTSEVQRNVIAERILGLPRDPEPEG